ncbi:unnamed protein product, partial [Iphiclides podalirius]
MASSVVGRFSLGSREDRLERQVRRGRGVSRAGGGGGGPAQHVAGGVHVASERLLGIGCVSAATIEFAQFDTGLARPRCWSVRPLDRHGYIDMGTDSSRPPWDLAGYCTPDSSDRLFLSPPAPLPPMPYRVPSCCHYSGTLQSQVLDGAAALPQCKPSGSALIFIIILEPFYCCVHCLF